MSLALTVNGESAGTLGGDAAVGIGPESADVVTVQVAPTSAAKIAIADALAERRNVENKLAGTLVATPEGGAPRTFRIDRGNTLNPAPGLPGVLR